MYRSESRTEYEIFIDSIIESENGFTARDALLCYVRRSLLTLDADDYWLARLMDNDFGRFHRRIKLSLQELMFNGLDDFDKLMIRAHGSNQWLLLTVLKRIFLENESFGDIFYWNELKSRLHHKIKNITSKNYKELPESEAEIDRNYLLTYAFIAISQSNNFPDSKKNSLYNYLSSTTGSKDVYIVSSFLFNQPQFCSGLFTLTSVVGNLVLKKREECIPYILIAADYKEKKGCHQTWLSLKGTNYYNLMLEYPRSRGDRDLQLVLKVVWPKIDWNPDNHTHSAKANLVRRTGWYSQLQELKQGVDDNKHHIAEHEEKIGKIEDRIQNAPLSTTINNNYYGAVGQSVGNAQNVTLSENATSKDITHGKSESEQLQRQTDDTK